MAVFPRLPVLARLQAALTVDNSRLRRTSLVCLQHLLETTGSLFEALIASGLPAQHIHVMGKTYSNSPQVVQALGEVGVQFHSWQRLVSVGRLRRLSLRGPRGNVAVRFRGDFPVHNRSCCGARRWRPCDRRSAGRVRSGSL